jgi:hypothetical protein
MPRSSSWRHRVSQILTALRTLDSAELQTEYDPIGSARVVVMGWARYG